MIAGLTLLVIAVPEQLATSRLAEMPPATALWAFVAATSAFFLFGASAVVSVGADSTIAPLFAAAVARVSVAGSPHALALTSLIALVSGVLVLLVGIFRLGWIADFLSVPIITGFMAGVAAVITVHQLPDVLGAGSASGSLVHRLHEIFTHIGSTNGWCVGIALVVLAIMVVGDRVDRRIPSALIGLVGASVLVAADHLTSRGVGVLGPVATGLPRLSAPAVSWGDIGTVLPVSLTVAVVCLGQTAATVRSFDADADPGAVNQDFVAVGVGNVVSGFAGAFAVNASPARSSVVSRARGRTQAACLLAALVVAVASPAAGELRHVPLAALAAILLFVASRLLHVGDLRAIARFSRVELGLAAVTAVVVAFVGVEQGIALAVLLAVFDRARHSARPRLIELGHVPDTTSWAPLHGPDVSESVPGIRVVMFAGPLFFANAGEFRALVSSAVTGTHPPRALVLDAAGMGDIDYTGSATLLTILDQLDAHHIGLFVARAGDEVMANLKESGILERIGTTRVFETVDEAARAAAAMAHDVPGSYNGASDETRRDT